MKFIIPLIILLGSISIYVLYSNRTKFNPQINSTGMVTKPTTVQNPIIDLKADWKIHTNTKLGFTVSYPENWIFKKYDENWVEIQNQEDNYVGQGLFASDTTGILSINLISIAGVYANGQTGPQISEQEFFNPKSNYWLKRNSNNNITYLPLTETTIAGKRVMKQTYYLTTVVVNEHPRQITTEYFIWLGNSANEAIYITTQYVETNANKEMLLKTFDEIISTFTFTNN